MRMMRIGLAVAAVAAVGIAPRAMAFHDGGVAYCEGCHTMHNSLTNKAMAKNGKAQFTGNTHLLQGSDASSTCLGCHASTSALGGHIVATSGLTGGLNSTDIPKQLTPAGDFFWLKLDLSWTVPRNGTNPKDRHGHNIVAADFGYTPDVLLTTAPGGSYSNQNLGCVSCHDPHGQARVVDQNGTIVTPSLGNAVKPICASGSAPEAATAVDTNCAVGTYRLLGSAGYKDLASNVTFSANAPLAIAPDSYNRSEASTDTRIAYGRGVSLWCANCHSQIHNTGLGAKLIHPTDQTLSGDVITNYNAYKKSGDLTGVVATSYSSLIPIEEGDTPTLTILASHAVSDGSVTGGADAMSRVMCLSCHRAHASGFQSMTRWNVRAEFLTIDGDYAGVDQTGGGENSYGNYAAGYTRAQYRAAMYDRPGSSFAWFQRSLCNKCHAKD